MSAPGNFSDFIVKSAFTAYAVPADGIAQGLDASNDIAIYPFIVPYPLEVSTIDLKITTGDGSHNSDVGIYDASGNLVADIGAQEISVASSLSFSLSGGSVVIGPGLYFLAFTSAADVLGWAIGMDDDGENMRLTRHYTTSTSSGGSLPSTITISESLSDGTLAMHQGNPPVMILH